MSKELEALEFLTIWAEEGREKYGEKQGFYPVNLSKEMLIEALTELEQLKNWKNELLETIEALINKTKYWEEKENKTEFEKGIARGYKTMLHHLLTNIEVIPNE